MGILRRLGLAGLVASLSIGCARPDNWYVIEKRHEPEEVKVLHRPYDNLEGIITIGDLIGNLIIGSSLERKEVDDEDYIVTIGRIPHDERHDYVKREIFVDKGVFENLKEKQKINLNEVPHRDYNIDFVD